MPHMQIRGGRQGRPVCFIVMACLVLGPSTILLAQQRKTKPVESPLRVATVASPSKVISASTKPTTAATADTAASAAPAAPATPAVPAPADSGDRDQSSEKTRAPVESVSQDSLLGQRLFEKMLKATAWIVAMPPEGASYSWGTGWIVDAQERLIVTNHHVVWRDKGLPVHDDSSLRVYFPEYEQGELLTDREDRLRNGKWYHATIIDSDPARDLALLVVDKLPDDAITLPIAERSASPGERIHSLGNPGASSALWVYTFGTVRQVYKTREWLGGIFLDYTRLECQSPTNSGDSGGPAVNDRGQIIAVNHAAHTDARLMTYMVDVRELRAYLEQARPWLHPTSADDFNTRGIRYYQHERFDAAIRDFSQAAKLDPKMSNAVNNRAWCFLQKGDHSTAIADFNAAIAANGNDSNYYQGRGRALAASNELSKAVEDFTQSIRLQGDRPDFYYDRAEAYYSLTNYDNALKDYQQASRLQPARAEFHNAVGVTYDVMEQHDDAIAAYSRAIELEPNNATFLYNRALTYHKMDDPANTTLDLIRMEQTDPDFAQSKRETLYRRLFRVTNDTQETLQVWVMYHTVTTKDEWEWFPADPSEGRWIVRSLAPGESSIFSHDDFRINADRVRIWAGNAPPGQNWQESTRMWTEYEHQDLVLVPDEGETGYLMGTYEYHLK